VFPYLGFASNSSCASFGSRVSRTTSISWPEATEPLWRTTFRIFTLRLRAVASLLLALERRRIAHPRLRTTRVSRWDYSRDLRQAKWGSGISLHGGNPEPLMSALGQKQTSARRSLMSALPPKRTLPGDCWMSALCQKRTSTLSLRRKRLIGRPYHDQRTPIAVTSGRGRHGTARNG
jgi:hypothetical protein